MVVPKLDTDVTSRFFSVFKIDDHTEFYFSLFNIFSTAGDFDTFQGKK